MGRTQTVFISVTLPTDRASQTMATSTGNNISSEAALKLLKAAEAKSRELRVKMNIAVVDSGANLVGFLRMDGAWLGSVDIAIKKAKTATFFQMNTEVIGSLSQPGGALFNIEHSNNGMISFPGGLPLTSGSGQMIGGIGVSGSTVENDKIVAEAASRILNH